MEENREKLTAASRYVLLNWLVREVIQTLQKLYYIFSFLTGGADRERKLITEGIFCWGELSAGNTQRHRIVIQNVCNIYQAVVDRFHSIFSCFGSWLPRLLLPL